MASPGQSVGHPRRLTALVIEPRVSAGPGPRPAPLRAGWG
jgi:hypothetical protein